MIKKLIKLANELDKRGLKKEADTLDGIVKGAAKKKKKKALYTAYTAAFLTDTSRKELYNWWKSHLETDTLDRVPAHSHMTIKSKPSAEEVLSLPIGEEEGSIKLTVVGYAKNDLGQAVRVSGFESSNDHAHITISVSKDAPGGFAYSDDLLGTGITPVNKGPVLDARIGFHNGREVRYNFEGSIYEE